MMNKDEFWRLVDSARPKPSLLGRLAGHAPRRDKHAALLRAALTRLSTEDLIAFDGIERELMNSAYRWDLWGAAYIINGGCSDDGFEYFRAWLISHGRETFERALGDPDSLADLTTIVPYECEFEEFLYLPAEVYEQRAGGDLPRVTPRIGNPDEPTGDRWEEDGEDLQRLCPRLWSKYGEG